MCCLRKPIQLEKSKPASGDPGQRGPQRSKNVQGTCAAAGDLCQSCFFLILLANLQSGSHQRMEQTVCEELQEASRKYLSDELKKFIEGSHPGGGQGRRVDVLSGGVEGDESWPFR